MNRIIIALLLISSLGFGQFNLQQHYDLGRGIQTTTAEFFTVQGKDVVFAFADINYDSRHFDKTGATDIWFELAWYHSLPLINSKLNGTFQYNDGIYFYADGQSNLATAVQPAWLGGVSYPFQLGDLTMPVDLLLRNQAGDDQITFQATVVWFYMITKRLVASGFVDLWTNADGPALSIMSEPQLTYSFGKASLGMEVEISRSFAGAWTKDKEYFDESFNPREKDWWFIPTLFVKYTF